MALWKGDLPPLKTLRCGKSNAWRSSKCRSKMACIHFCKTTPRKFQDAILCSKFVVCRLRPNIYLHYKFVCIVQHFLGRHMAWNLKNSPKIIWRLGDRSTYEKTDRSASNNGKFAKFDSFDLKILLIVQSGTQPWLLLIIHIKNTITIPLTFATCERHLFCNLWYNLLLC